MELSEQLFFDSQPQLMTSASSRSSSADPIRNERLQRQAAANLLEMHLFVLIFCSYICLYSLCFAWV